MQTSAGTQSGPRHGPERRRVMSAQTPYIQADVIGVFPTLLMLLVLVVTAMGILAHVAFA